MAPRLPKYEVFLNAVIGIGSIATICYHVFLDSRGYYTSLNPGDFTQGWRFLQYPKDVSNFEWTFWSDFFLKVLPWYFGYMLLGLVLQLLKMHQNRRFLLTAYSVCGLCYLMGIKIVSFYVLHSTVAFLSSTTKSKTIVWFTSIALLSTLNIEMFNSNFHAHIYDIDKDPEGKIYYIFVFCLALMNLRYISFCLERCDATVSKPTYFDFMVYLLYLPLFFTGPVLTYDLFSKHIYSEPPVWTILRVKDTIFNFLRVLFWGLFNEIILHFLYFGSIHQQPNVLRQISLWTLVGLAYCEGQFFMTKYLVMYELPGQIAKFEGIEAPKGPKCISYIYRYSDLWKTFDKGFYNFLKRYVYIPVGGSKLGIHRKLFGSFLCFMFIFIWHGAEFYLFMWCVLNYLGCTIEYFGDWFVSTKYAKKYVDKISTFNRSRLKGLLSVPLYLTSSMGIFVFFNGVTVGRIFFYRLLVDISWPVFIFFICLLYCNIQNAIQVQHYLKNNLKSIKKH